jgi:hypothetical protein
VRGDVFSGMNRSPSLPELLSLSFREIPAGKRVSGSPENRSGYLQGITRIAARDGAPLIFHSVSEDTAHNPMVSTQEVQQRSLPLAGIVPPVVRSGYQESGYSTIPGSIPGDELQKFMSPCCYWKKRRARYGNCKNSPHGEAGL